MKEITFFERFGYGLGDLASNLFWMQFVWFLNYFYTDVFGLAPAVLATMILVVRIWDSANDPIIGIIADRTNTRWGKFRPYLLWGALPFAIVGGLTFTTPNLSPGGKLIYAYLTYGSMVLIYTVVNIPYSSLMGVVSPDPSVRTKFSQMRFIMAFTGGLIVQATTLPMVASFGASAEGVVKTELIESKVFITEQSQGSSRLEVSTLSPDYKDPNLVQKLGLQFGLVNEKDLGKATKKKTIYVNTPEYYQEAGLSTGQQSGAFEDIAYLTSGFASREFELKEIFKDVDLSDKTIEVQVINEQKGFSTTMTLFGFAAAILFVITFATTRERVQPPPSQKTSLGRDVKDLISNKPWLILFAVGIISLFHVCLRNGAIIYWCKYNLGNEKIGPLFMLAGTLANLVSMFIVSKIEFTLGKKKGYILCMLGTFVLSGLFYLVPESNTGLLITVHVLINLMFGPTAALVWAMYTDAADYGEWKTGRRATGLVMSACTMAQKFGYTFGGALGLAVLSYVGYKANSLQSDATLAGIKGMVSWISALPCALGVVLMVFYPLNEDLLKSIENDLDERRQNDA
ncbi:MFS transporter [Lentisphaera marina]|uniref:MFS transporter n=1 Tax=Lentisphaera marina TaxID=1111041 RepID=UPI002365BB89|nr:MFS transporter [Lentisphaera marina]MDD7986432.1 MFS transporter [Lentisphaera marina]